MKQKRSWTWWEEVQERSLNWQDVWSMDQHQLKFLLCSVNDVLLTPKNLHRCELSESWQHIVWETNQHGHILSSCQTSLMDGKFWWQHDKVLAVGLEQAKNETDQKNQVNGWFIDGVDVIRQIKFPEETVFANFWPNRVKRHKASGFNWAGSALGREDERGKVQEIPVSCPEEPEEGLKGLESTSYGWLQWESGSQYQ